MAKRIAIIGAGISGLTAIKQCLVDDLIPICFEQNSFIGGIWRYEDVYEKNNDPYSSVYKGVLTNTSKEMTTFSDFPIPIDWPTYLNHSLVEKYIDIYAEHFNLLPHIKFNTTVLRITILHDKHWKVKYIIQCENEEKEEVFDFVMVCTGKHRKPKWPEFKGMNLFKGKQIHSYMYKRATDFEDKRVLVVGCANSAMDIAVELTHAASQVYLSIRREKLPWILPRFINAGTVIVKSDIKELNSENNRIEFVDGTVLENIDVVIYSTGYDIEYPFLEKHIFTGGDEIVQEFEKDFCDLVWLYKSMFPPKYPNIAFMGLTVAAGAILPISEMQARYITSHIKGLMKPLPSQYEMEKSIRNNYENIRKNSCKHARSAIRQNYLSYMDTLSKDIGCYPYSYEIIKKFGFRFWQLIMFGIATPIQYRLLGRDSWEGAREAILLYNKDNFKHTVKSSK
ncbi:6504_t:CDS:10, partial [Cetraspora pellucida]